MDLLIKGAPKSDQGYLEEMRDAVVAVMEVVAKQEFSGGAFHVFSRLFDNLVRFRPVTPLTFADDEWIHQEEDVYQNNRCPAVFKKGKSGKPYNIDGYVFHDKYGQPYTNRFSKKPMRDGADFETIHYYLREGAKVDEDADTFKKYIRRFERRD